MRPTLTLIAASTLLLATACTTTPLPPQTIGQCNAEPASWAIGRAPDQNLIDDVLRDTGSRDVRVLEPGMAATMDYRADRVNIDVNDRGAITGIRCG
ncbi:I78 family peptidase inhibitor [Marilutibacter alkalisoli]|uniref:Peptidase inhibitor I78 family protein n=1 Tax=Marilutibacter alkalisoli TaxID=2591633 RepID=A0A514BN30_9GAMM|nr:I78 family peptidase inhibitor [Lysobacter alkalisoli]QDH68782.1 hypothetical protein FKV23_00630 [Lysobacter alkalisoli]